MYILYSIVVSALIFGAYQYFDSINRDTSAPNFQPYDINRDLITANNIMIYVIILSIVFCVIYMAFNDDTDLFTSLGIFDNDHNNLYEIKKTNVNPSIFRNTTFPMKMGFEPYNSGGSEGNSGSDTSSAVASSECSDDSE
jgi:hypothetical protein